MDSWNSSKNFAYNISQQSGKKLNRNVSFFVPLITQSGGQNSIDLLRVFVEFSSAQICCFSPPFAFAIVLESWGAPMNLSTFLHKCSCRAGLCTAGPLITGNNFYVWSHWNVNTQNKTFPSPCLGNYTAKLLLSICHEFTG